MFLHHFFWIINWIRSARPALRRDTDPLRVLGQSYSSIASLARWWQQVQACCWVWEATPPCGGPDSVLGFFSKHGARLLQEFYFKRFVTWAACMYCINVIQIPDIANCSFFLAVIGPLFFCRSDSKTWSCFHPLYFPSPPQPPVPFTLSRLWIEFSSFGPSGARLLPSLCLNSSVKRKGKKKKCWVHFFF